VSRGRRRIRGIVGVVALICCAALLWVAFLPVPPLDRYIAATVAKRVADQFTCASASGAGPKVTVRTDRPAIRTVLSGRVPEVTVTVPDVNVGGVDRVLFTSTLRGLSQPSAKASHADSVESALTIGFANLPIPPGQPQVKFHSGAAGTLILDTTSAPGSAGNVRATVFLRLALRGETLVTTPEKTRLFGRTIPADKVAQLTGGERRIALPHLPEGLRYRSVVTGRDGLQVSLGGVVNTPLTALPAKVDGRALGYTAEKGLLGITSTLAKLPLLPDPTVTILTQPTLGNGVVTLVPRTVRTLGADQSPNGVIGKLVLSQVSPDSLRQKLPALPTGVRYQSVSVDGGGIKVAVGGTTVQPYRKLPAPAGVSDAVFGTEGGFLTVSAKSAKGGAATAVQLVARPAIKGNVLSLRPSQIRMFGTTFPAADVLANIATPTMTFPLQAPPTNLEYQAVEVLPDGLRIHMRGSDVTIPAGMIRQHGCSPGAAP
jgi:hypothetical protein